jgi:xanthine dehydrogenase D subunit
VTVVDGVIERLGPPLVGQSVARPDVPAKIDGSFEYANDVSVPGMLFCAVTRSPHAHARIVGIDTTTAAADPGVVLCLTAADVPGELCIGHIARDQPVLADGVVRYHGEPVVAVIATTQEQAWLAADRVVVRYEPLPAVTDPMRALDDDATLVHPTGTLVRRLHLRNGVGAAAVADVVVEGTWSTGRQEQAFLAPESAVAVPDQDGGVTLHLATQDLHVDRTQIAAALALPEDLVRLEMAGIGGAFGGREDITLQVHLCLAARLTGRAVKTTYRRGESFLSHPKRHPTEMRFRVGADEDGTLRFVHAHIVLDGGAYASTSGPVTGSAAYFAAGPYRVPSVDIIAESVYTNNPVSGAMRGFGAVQACFGIESTMDLLAARLAMDPVELRRRNALRSGDRFPTSGQLVVGPAPVLELIDACVSLPMPVDDPDDPFALPGGLGRTSRGAVIGKDIRRGVGFALGVKNHLYAGGMQEHATATVLLDRVGVEVRSAAADVGQGISSALAQIAGDALGGVPVRTAKACAAFGYAGSSSASRQTYISGGAVLQAADQLAAKVREKLAVAFTVEASEIEFAAASVFVDGYRHTWTDLWSNGHLGDEPIVATAEFSAPETTEGDDFGQGDVHVGWMFVAHRAVVDVDVELGLLRVAQVATAQEVGRAINPREVRGQINGGISQGLGLAVMENLHSDGGVVCNPTFTDYLIPTAADMAATQIAVIEVADPNAPLGMKGVGEPPSLSSTPAIAAAVRAATGRAVQQVPIRPDDLVL